MVKFNENSAIKAKDYPVDNVVEDKERCLIDVITYNECIFSANNKL